MSYKLSTVLLNIERFKNDNPDFEINSNYKGSDEWIILSSVLDYIFKRPNWGILQQFDYSKADLKMITSGFIALRILHYDNDTPVWTKFVEELIEENIEALGTTGKSVTQRAMQVANQQQVSDRFDPSNDVVAYMEFKNNNFMVNYHQVMFAVEGEKDVYNYLDDIKAYILTQARSEQITGEQTTALLKWAFEGFVQQVVFGTTEPDFNEIQNFTYNLEVSDAKAYLTSMDVNFANFLEEVGFFNYSDTGNDDPDAINENTDYDSVLLTEEYSDDLTEYHNAMLAEPENPVEFVLDIMIVFFDLSEQKNWSQETLFKEIKWGLSNVVTDRLFTESTSETDEMYDTPNYNLTKEEFFNKLALQIENEGEPYEFDTTDLLAEIFGTNDLDMTEDEENYAEIRSEMTSYLATIISANPNKDIYYWDNQDWVSRKPSILKKINSIQDIPEIKLPHEFYENYEGYESLGYVLFVFEGYSFKVYEYNIVKNDDTNNYEVAPWSDCEFTYNPEANEFTEIDGYSDERMNLNDSDDWRIADQLREILNEDVTTDEDDEFNKGLKEWLTNNIATDYQLNPDNENYMGYLNTGIGMMDGYDEYFTSLSNDPDYWNEWMRNNLNMEMSTYSHPEEIIFDRIEDNKDEEDETFVSIEIMPDADVAEVLERSAPKYGVNYVTGDGEIFLQGPYEKVKYFIKTEYDRNFDFSDFYDKYEKNWKVSSLEITSQELHDSGEYISGYFNFVCDDDYTSAGFTYYADDTPTEIDELDSDYEDEFEKGGEFHNELIYFIEDNVDTDLFEENESLTYEVEADDNENTFEVTISEDNEPIYSCIFDYSELLILTSVEALDGESGEIEPEDFDKDMEAECMFAIQTYVEENNWERKTTEDNDYRIENLEVKNEYLELPGKIVGEFSFDYGDENVDGEFSYYEDRSIETKIDKLHDRYFRLYEEDEEFGNELIYFIEDNVDTDLFDNQGDEETIQEFFENLPKEDESDKPSDDSIIERFETAGNFPNIKVEFYYPYDETFSEFNIDNKKIAEAFNFLFNTEDFEEAENDFSYLSEQIVNFSERKDEMTAIDFSDMLNNLATNIPGSDLSDNEEMLYLNFPNSYTRFRISVSAMTHQWLEEFFKK